MIFRIYPDYMSETQESRWSKIFSFVFSIAIGFVVIALLLAGLEETRVEIQKREANKVINVRIVE